MKTAGFLRPVWPSPQQEIRTHYQRLLSCLFHCAPTGAQSQSDIRKKGSASNSKDDAEGASIRKELYEGTPVDEWDRDRGENGNADNHYADPDETPSSTAEFPRLDWILKRCFGECSFEP